MDDCQSTNLTKLKEDPWLMYILVHSSLFLVGKNSLKSEIKNKKILEIFNHNLFELNLGKFCQIFYTWFRTSSPSSLIYSKIWLNIPRDDCHMSYITKLQENTPIHPDQKLGFTRMWVQVQLQHKSIFLFFKFNLI